MVKRVTGMVRWFSPAKGYGIITLENGPDVYVHREVLQKSGVERLYRGQEIKFTFTQVGEKYQARNIFAHRNSDLQRPHKDLFGGKTAAAGGLDGDVTIPPKKRGG